MSGQYVISPDVRILKSSTTKIHLPWIYPRPRGGSLYRVVTVFGKKEFATIRLYCRRKRLSLYALAKAAIREYVEHHP